MIDTKYAYVPLTPPQPLLLQDVPRFRDQPIRKVPQYVFENCNQATCNTYDPEFLSQLRSRTKTLTVQILEGWSKGNPTRYVQKGEELDWIYGLDALENEFLAEKSPDQLLEELLKIETVIKYNGLFSRFANENPGAFRKKEILWAKRDLEINEMLASSLFDEEFQRQMGAQPHLFFAHKRHKQECIVKKAWIMRKCTQLISEGFQIQGSEKTKKYLKDHWHELNMEKAASDWIKTQDRKDGKLDLVQWFKTRYHYFPLASTIAEDLKQSLQGIREAKEMHPIEKACRVWFEVVRIHISGEANKRTGKALASFILLIHGYLPPKIGKEDEKEFLDVLKQGLEEKDGHLRLTQFVVKMILKTQKEYAGLAL